MESLSPRLPTVYAELSVTVECYGYGFHVTYSASSSYIIYCITKILVFKVI